MTKENNNVRPATTTAPWLANVQLQRSAAPVCLAQQWPGPLVAGPASSERAYVPETLSATRVDKVRFWFWYWYWRAGPHETRFPPQRRAEQRDLPALLLLLPLYCNTGTLSHGLQHTRSPSPPAGSGRSASSCLGNLRGEGVQHASPGSGGAFWPFCPRPPPGPTMKC